jgi:hypothetical protein
MVRKPPLRWRFGAKRFDNTSVAFHVDGWDLVHISEIDADGNAFIIVFESSHPDAEVLFTGRINVAHRKNEDHDAPAVHGNPVQQRHPQHRAEGGRDE